MNEPRPRAVACLLVLLLAPTFPTGRAMAADAPRETLHVRIDRLLESDRVGPEIAPASDAEYLRRVSLDLTGMPPTAEELRSFLADKDPEKKGKAVDRLLASPHFARHWAATLDVMLMERLANQQVPADQWEAFLLDAARRNRPFNELVAELLKSDGGDMKHREPSRFYLDRESEPNRITRDVGRIFFGVDLQCAQCHNHPLVPDYRQSDYQGLLAFFNPGSELVKMEGAKKTTFFPEKAGRDVPFDSVFVKDDHHLTGPRLPGGTELDEPAFPPGDEYKVKPVGDTMPVPKHSRRAMLASVVSAGEHRAFNENFANRLWAMMMGRGLVHPVDLRHPGNPPTHPELLAMLGREIAASRFDVRPFLRELALTKVYQSSIDLPGELKPLPPSFAADLEALKSRMTTTEADAERAEEVYQGAEKAWHKAESALVPLAAEEEKAVAAHAAATKKEDEAKAALAAAEKAVAERRETAKALADASARAEEVVKKLPKEKDLVDAARVFANRAKAVANEVTALEKASGEKAAAAKKTGEERAAVAGTIVAAREKMRPVRESVRREEAATLEARRKLSEARATLENLKRRLYVMETYGRWHQIRDQIRSHSRESEALEPALAAALKRADEQMPVLRAREGEAKAAETHRAAAEKDVAEAQGGLARQKKAAEGVDAALAATRAALALLPGDDALGKAAATLDGRANELKASLTGFEERFAKAEIARNKAADAVRAASQALDAGRAERDRLAKDVGAAKEKIAAARARAEALQAKMAEATEDLTRELGSRFAMAQLKPLTPEQLYWSMLKATGVYDRTLAAQEAELDNEKAKEKEKAKGKPESKTAANDPAARRDRALEIERRTHDKLKSGLGAFIQMYSAGPGQPQHDFFATADQALFASNGGSLNGWIAPAGGNVSQRMIAEKDARKASEDLYLTILSRSPTADEAAEVVRMLSVPDKEKPAVVQELVWGLLTSVEFRFNH